MNKAEHPRKALGKGLHSLIPPRAAPPPPQNVEAPPAPEDAARNLPIRLIDSNPAQPRRTFEAEKLEELAQSIRANGIVQPLVVRKSGVRFQLVAGERRLRAAKQAGLEEVPVIVRDIPDERLLEITLIENIQREDLNPIETATAFGRMLDELYLSPEAVGRRTGKNRTTIVNFMRLLQLPKDIQEYVADQRLSAGHARCLLTLPNPDLQREMANRTVAHGWSVRELERQTQKMAEPAKPEKAEDPPADPNVRAAIEELERALGTKVRIVEKARGAGRIIVEYYSADDLDRIYSVIVGER